MRLSERYTGDTITASGGGWSAPDRQTGMGHEMKTFALAVGLMACAALVARADDKIDLTGKYTLVSGKKEGKDFDEKAKKFKYSATADTITVEGGDVKFVYGYKLKPDTAPVEIDMAVSEGPEGTKGTIAFGIIEVKGDTVKIAYSMDKAHRPKNFDGKTDFLIELKKAK
jgi:uncharacterized protein (TIGR03067 family)